jgi:hypothetical protein
LLEYNNQLREQLEQVLGRLQEGRGTDPELVEEISIFQNKMASSYPSRVLDNVRKKVSESGGLEHSKTVGGDQTAGGNDAALWTIGPGGATISSTLRDVDVLD